MGKQSFSFLSFLPSFLVIILGFLFCFLFGSVPMSLSLRCSMCASKVVEWECKTRRKGRGGRYPPQQMVFVFSHSRILALYWCYEMWVWSGGTILVIKGIAYDMA